MNIKRKESQLYAKRREFLGLGVGLLAVKGALNLPLAVAAQGAKVTEKSVLKEGQAAAIAGYCEHPDKQPNKFCPDWKAKPGHCKECMFYNKDNSETTFKGGKIAHCQLLADPTKAQFVSEGGYCSTFVKKT